MHTYRATATLSVGEGTVLHLTEAQAKSRLHHLAAVDVEAGVYRATAVLQFKRGETVVMEQALPKGFERYAEHVSGAMPAEEPVQMSADPAEAPQVAPAAQKPSGKKRFFSK